MIPQLIMSVLGSNPSPAALPSVASVTVSTVTPGACSSGVMTSSAIIQAAWTVVNPDGGNWTANVYENGVLVQSSAGTSGSYFKTIGLVDNGPVNQITTNWTYRVELVRNSDSKMLSSKSSAAWVHVYGTCS